MFLADSSCCLQRFVVFQTDFIIKSLLLWKACWTASFPYKYETSIYDWGCVAC